MSQSSRWETHRGDEWWYSDLFLEANAGFNKVPAALVIGELKSRGTLSVSRLHVFLWHTHQQFQDAQIWLLLTPVTRPLVETLGQAGDIRWDLIQNPLSVEARILSVNAPSVTPNNSFKPKPLRGSA